MSCIYYILIVQIALASVDCSEMDIATTDSNEWELLDWNSTLTDGSVSSERLRGQSKLPPYRWNESWHGHTEQLTRVNRSAFVNFYFDPIMTRGKTRLQTNNSEIVSVYYNASWLFDFTANVWDYMTHTYGNFGPDHHLNLVVHQGSYNGSYIRYSIDSESVMTDRRNILDVSSPRLNAWQTESTRNENMDVIMNQLAYFVEFSSKDRWGSPSHNIWKGSAYVHTAWVDIFTYDVYTNLNLTQHAERYRAKTLNKVENHPKEITFWMKNWFLPIYTHCGGSKVLNKYFQLLHDSLPHRFEKYSQNLDMGEFVHFWSGATNTDLTELAQEAFGWNDDYQQQFQMANQRFPAVAELYTWDTLEKCSIKLPRKPGKTGEDPVIVIIGVVAGVAVIIVAVVVLTVSVLFYKKKIKSLQQELRSLTNEEVSEFFHGDPTANPDEGEELVQSMPFIKDFEIPREQMILDHNKVLGRGQFGSVIQGFVRQPECNQMLEVAMKTVKPNVEIMYFKAFLSEVKIMAYLGQHENIVRLLGTCTANIKNREIFIALEFCRLGNLHVYLKKNRHHFEIAGENNAYSGNKTGYLSLQMTRSNALSYNNWQENKVRSASTSAINSPASPKITISDLFKWSQNIANAMMYLTQKKVIHGDLAARNVLLTENRVAKISDFGLSRQFLNYANYMKTSKLPVPWRWLAIESLKDMKFSTASDVWAFGVTLWEIFSLAETPYGCWAYDLFFVDKLISGDRLLMPTYGNHQIYQVMVDCWKMDPSERPTFQRIHQQLEEFISKSQGIIRNVDESDVVTHAGDTGV